MNRKIPYDSGLILIVLALLGGGLIMVFSASSMISRELYGSASRIFVRQLLFVVIALMVMLGIMRIDYHWYARWRVIGPILAVTVLLLGIALFLPKINGAHRWVGMGPLRFQPSELAKLGVVLLTSFYLVSRRTKSKRSWLSAVAYLTVLAVVVGLVVIEPDLGTAVCIALTAGLLLYLGGLKYRYVVGLLLVALPSLYLSVWRVPYRRNRILAFLDPHRDPLGVGYHIRQSLIAVGSGGWDGVGYAQGSQRLFFLPEPQTDFIFAVVAEELGLWGSLLLLALFGFFFWKGVQIALRADSRFGTLVSLGITGMIVFQALINMSVAINLLPTKGIPLPFISVGGSSMLVMLAAIGVLLNISRQGRKEKGLARWVEEASS